MSRPATLKVGNTSYWTIMTYTSAGVLVDADSTPTVAVKKNGTAVADVVTVTKRSATTGIYDAYYNPSGEAEGDCFTIEETATISSQAYLHAWSLEVVAVERGTDNASTFDASSDTVTTDAASRTASQADVSALATSASIAALNDITVQEVWDALTAGSYASGSFGERLLIGQTTDRSVGVSASNQVSADVYALQSNVITAAAIATDAVTELQTGLVTVGTGFTYTNGAGDYHVVTIS